MFCQRSEIPSCLPCSQIRAVLGAGTSGGYSDPEDSSSEHWRHLQEEVYGLGLWFFYRVCVSVCVCECDGGKVRRRGRLIGRRLLHTA